MSMDQKATPLGKLSCKKGLLYLWIALIILGILTFICDALRDLVPFVQFKKREKHPRRSVNFSKVAG